MGKFAVECPYCAQEGRTSYVMMSKHLHQEATCPNGHHLHVDSARMGARKCPHCGSMVAFDQAKKKRARCPVCKEPINTLDDMKNSTTVHCPSCACELMVDKAAPTFECPLCDNLFDVQKQIAAEEARKKGVVSVIKYEGGNDVFVWKHPIEDFNLGSQLIVHESQEALFFRDGRALDLFGAGRYTLTTQNLPALDTLYKFPGGTDNFFHSEVYFINLTTHMGIKWGTDSKVGVFDPGSGLHVKIGACGDFNLRVADSRKFVLKVVGTTDSFLLSEFTGTPQDNGFGAGANPDQAREYKTKPVVKHFRGMINTKVKTFLSKAIKDNNVNLLEADAYLDSLSVYLRDRINEALEEYGLVMPEFYVTRILLPTKDEDPNFHRLSLQYAERTLGVRDESIKKDVAEAAAQRKMVEAQTAAQLKLIQAQAEAEAYKAKAFAEAAEMQAKGYTYQQETARQVGLEAMKNGITGGEGGGGGLGDIASLGITLGAMGGVIGMTKDAINPIVSGTKELGDRLGANLAGAQPAPAGWTCECGNTGITSKFCPACGKPEKKPDAGWTCPDCGTEGITSNFCPNCGAKKPAEDPGWTCPKCGAEGIKSKFCPNCGTSKPADDPTWTCPKCGTTNIQSKFCPECGNSKGD
ncbi:MAG: SPFH domain-containing protein [Clostridia bacterium]|nr:SPFH domain-containing protein [Clostridia bacterium]